METVGQNTRQTIPAQEVIALHVIGVLAKSGFISYAALHDDANSLQWLMDDIAQAVIDILPEVDKAEVKRLCGVID